MSDSPSSPPVNDEEDSEGLPSLDKPGWYSQGNWLHLQELLKTMTGKPEPKVGQSPISLKPEVRQPATRHLGLALRLTPTLVFGRG